MPENALHPHQLTLRLANQLTEIPRSAELVEAFLRTHGVAPGVISTANLCLEELVANTIAYGYGDTAPHEIEVQLAWDGATLVIDIADDGKPFDPTLAPVPDVGAALEDRPIGGLGIHLVRTLMDEVAYRREGGRNRVRLCKRLSPASPDHAVGSPGR
jgi:anti-sigma regulatory factor (Ser/Thr protein kinase)